MKDANGKTISTTDYKYSDNGSLKSTYTQNSDGTAKEVAYSNGKKAAAQTTDKNGKVTEFEVYNKETGNINNKEVYSYNENGQQTGTEKYTYDKEGNLATREKYNANQELETKGTYSYDKDGNMLRKDYSPTGEYKGSTESTFDRYGQLATETKTNAKGKTVFTITHEYHNSGIEALTTITSGKGDILSQKSYTETGVISKSQSYSKDSNGNYCLTETQYDEAGNKTTETKYNSQNSPILTTKYNNDEKGKPISAEILNSAGEKFGDVAYSYDKNGNITKVKTDYTNGLSKEMSYTYNDKNQLTSSTRTNTKGQTETTNNVYDDKGILIQQSKTGFDGQTTKINYKRDYLSRITEKIEIDKDGNSTKQEFTYALLNNDIKSVKITNPDGTITTKEYSYYPSGARKYEIESNNKDRQSYTVSIYDKDGNLIEEPSTVPLNKIHEVIDKLNPKQAANSTTTSIKGTPSILYTGAVYDKETGTYQITVETYQNGKVQDNGNGGTRYPNGSFWGIVENVYPEVSEAQKSTVYDIISKINNGKTSLYTGDVLKMPILVYDNKGNITGYKTETDGKVYSVPNASGNWDTTVQEIENTTSTQTQIEQPYTVRVDGSHITYTLNDGRIVDCVGNRYFSNGKQCFFDVDTGKISYSEFIQSSSNSGTFILPDGTEVSMSQGNYYIDGKPCRFNSSTGEYSFIKDDTNTTKNEIQRENFDTVLKNLTDDYIRNNGLWYTPDQILEVIESSGKSINELIAEADGNAESLKALDNALGNYTSAYEFIDQDNISDDLINIVSTVYDGRSGIIKELYDASRDQIINKVNPEYQKQFKDYIIGLSLSEMNENVDYFNKFVTEGLNKGYSISDARGWIAQEKRKGN